MKRFIFALALAVAIPAGAADLVEEVPLTDCGTAYSVSVSTSAWTKASSIDSDSRMDFRSGLHGNNLKSNSASLFGTLSKETPTISTTSAPIEIETGENPWINTANGLDLFLVSTHTASETFWGLECRQ